MLKLSKNNSAPYHYYSDGSESDPITTIGTITGLGGTITTTTATLYLIATVYRYIDITISAINATTGITWELSLDNETFAVTINPGDMTALLADNVATIYARAIVANDGSVSQPSGGVFNAPDLRIVALEAGGTLVVPHPSDTVSTADFGDDADAGDSEDYSRGDHKHAMPELPDTMPPSAHTHTAADLSGVVKTINRDAPDAAGNIVINTGGDSGSLPIGAIIRAAAAPTNCLYCDGSLLAQSEYANLYSTVGNSFSPYQNRYKNGQPWRQQYFLNSGQTADITGWTAGTSLPGALYGSAVVVTNSRVYLLGGATGSGPVATVYTAPINPDGTIGAWTTGTALPGPLRSSSVIVTNSRVYLLGGTTGSPVSTVYTATINPDGTLGAWSMGTALPGALYASQAIVTNSRVYLLGGGTGSGQAATSTVYTAPINPDGTIGAWTTGTALPGVLADSSVIVTNSRVYLLGGYTGSGGYVATVYTALINSDGTLGAWTIDTSLPGPLSDPSAIVTNSRVYLLGGETSAGQVATVYTATINPDGTLGAWTIGTSLPGNLAISQSIITNSRIYLLGGYAGSAVATVYTALFSGGLNAYLDKTFDPATPPSGQFYIPDLRNEEAAHMGMVKSYIKY